MRIETICARIAAELRKTDIVAAGLKQAYYPAGAVNETPAALVFTAGGSNRPTMNEQVWEHRIRVQLMVAAKGRLAAEINAIEPLIIPIFDHFTEGSNAYHLRVAGSDQMVHRCQPEPYGESEIINYSGHDYVAIPIYFNVKVQRFPGAE
jgi:hypothetical protein